MIEALSGDPSLWADAASELVVRYSGRVVGALVLLVFGWRFVKWATKTGGTKLQRRSVDPAVTSFALSFGGISLKLLLLFAVISVLGVPTSGFVAALGAAGLAVGMALSGTLSNVAGGVVLLVLRPFRIGHVIQAQGVSGVVHSISVFHTVLRTFDNETVFLPNGEVVNGEIVNRSLERSRRLDLSLHVRYTSDLAGVKRVLEELLEGDPRVLREPEPPLVGVGDLGLHTVGFLVRVWVESGDYVVFPLEFREAAKNALAAEGFEMGVPPVAAAG